MSNDLRQALSAGPVEVEFIKSDGTLRRMLATTNGDHFTYQYQGGSRVHDHRVIAVWDLLNEGWRSIRLDRVLSWKA